MLKKLIAGFILLVAVVAVVEMSVGSKAIVATEKANEAQAQVAVNERPENLKHLKRLAVRDACTKHADWDMETCQALDKKEVMFGMTAEQVRMAWGKPIKVNTTASVDHVHEQWVYAGGGYVYLENGIVRTVQN